MEITFSDANLCAVFNRFSLLCSHYGDEVAKTIMIRMSVLAAAPALSAVPEGPPVDLKTEGVAYSVSVGDHHRLHFQPANGVPVKAPHARTVTKIEVTKMVALRRQTRRSAHG